MRDVLEDLEAWTARGDRVALATVVGVRRSAPRPPGSKMAVSDQGDVSGAVSGGCVEGSVVQVAEEVLAGGEPRLLSFGIADEEAWDVGLPCGGEIDVWVERFEEAAGPRRAAAAAEGQSPQARFAGIARDGGRAALVTVLDAGAGEAGATVGARLLVDASGTVEGSLGDTALDRDVLPIADQLMWAEHSELRELAGAKVFVDVVFPPPRLLVFGAVDFAGALCAMAGATGWRPFVIDPRSRFAAASRFPAAEEVIAAWPEEAVAGLGGIDRATSVAILTHDPKLDDAALLVALRSPAPYVGAMGSRRAQERRRERLLAAGLTDEELDRLAAPIGLDLGAITAEETALAIMAEIVAVRHGHEGGRLAQARGRIHEVGA